MSKTSDDCDPTFSRNADGTRVVDPRISGFDLGLQRSVDDAMRSQFAGFQQAMRPGLVTKSAKAFVKGAVHRLQEKYEAHIVEKLTEERKARARNEKRLLRGYRPRHVRASV